MTQRNQADQGVGVARLWIFPAGQQLRLAGAKTAPGGRNATYGIIRMAAGSILTVLESLKWKSRSIPSPSSPPSPTDSLWTEIPAGQDAYHAVAALLGRGAPTGIQEGE